MVDYGILFGVGHPKTFPINQNECYMRYQMSL